MRGRCVVALCLVSALSAPFPATAQAPPDVPTPLDRPFAIMADQEHALLRLAVLVARQAPVTVDALLAARETVRANDRLIRPHLEETLRKVEATESASVVSRQREMLTQYQARMDRLFVLLDEIAGMPRQRAAPRRLLGELRDALATHQAPERPVLRNALAARSTAPPARRPVTSPALTPAYASNPMPRPTAEDTASIGEVALTPDLAALVEARGREPITIYDWVRATIETEWYDGAMKPAFEVFRAKAGNGVDQAALLIAVYRALGIPSRYVHGVIELDAAQAQAWMGVDDAAQVSKVLDAAGIPFQETIRGGRMAAVRLAHTWVEAYVPYGNYRGAALEAGGEAWVPLDPSFKPHTVTPGTDLWDAMGLDAATGRDAYIRDGEVASPLDVLTRTINGYLAVNRPDLTFADLLRTSTVDAPPFGLLPNTLPYKIVAVTGEGASLPEALRHRVRFVASDARGTLMEATLPLTEVAGRRLTLSYEPETVEDHHTILSFGGQDLTPAYLIHLRPVLKVDGAKVAAGTRGLAMGAMHELTIDLAAPWGGETVQNTLVTGGYSAITLTAPGQSDQAPASPLPQDTEFDAASHLFGLAAAYQRQWQASEATLARLLRFVPIRPQPSVTVVGLVQEPSYLFGVPQALDFRGAFIDAGLWVTNPVAMEPSTASRDADFRRLSALEGSFWEHGVFEEQWQVESMSTVKALQRCVATPGCQLQTLTGQNVDTVLPALGLPPEVATDIANAIARRLTVLVPTLPLTHRAWSGAGYLAEDPATGEAGYFLSGRIAGGMTIEPIDGWALPDLLAQLQFPYEESANSDPSAVVALQRVKLFVDRGVVNRPLASPVYVWARDAHGRPVRGVDLTVSITAGGGRVRGMDLATGELKEGVSVIVRTDRRGLADVEWILGQSTANHPAYLKVQSDDAHDTQVGENVLMASAHGVRGPIELAAPYVAYGLPDAPVRITKVFGEGARALPNTPAGSLRVVVVDQYDNPISNVPVTFTSQPPVSKNSAVSLPPSARGVIFYTRETCPSAYPLVGDPGCQTANPMTLPTQYFGALVNTILGNTVNTRYDVEVSAPNVPSALFTLASLGNRGPNDYLAPSLYLRYLDIVNGQGEPVNAAKAGTPLRAPLTAGLFLLSDEYTMEGPLTCVENGQPYACYTIQATGVVNLTPITTDAPINTGTVTFSPVAGGGSVGPTQPQASGRYQSSFTPGSQPAVHTIHAIGQATVRVPQVFFDVVGKTAITAGYRTATLPEEDVQLRSGQAVMFSQGPPATSLLNGEVETVVYTVYGVDVTVNSHPDLVLLTKQMRTAPDVTFEYTIEPAAYEAPLVQVDLLRNGTRVATIMGERGQGTGAAGLARGFEADLDGDYQAEAVLNRGTSVEIRGSQAPMPVGQVTLLSEATREPVQGAVTDGATKLILQLMVKHNQGALLPLAWALADPQIENSTIGLGTLMTGDQAVDSIPVTFDGDVAEATYRVPDAFVRFTTPQEEADGERPERAAQVTFNNRSDGAPTIRLRRPPVVLVHGLWSDKKTWATFEAQLNKRQQFTIGKADYSGGDYSNAGRLSQNDSVIGKHVDRALRIMEGDRLAATKVDLVTHSMGGLLVREFCRQNLVLCTQQIHKLITIDTPHRGSELADLLVVYRDHRDLFPNPILSFCHKRVGIFVHGDPKRGVKPHPVDQGAVDDLASGRWTDYPFVLVSGGAWQRLPDLASQLVAHAIVATAASPSLFGGDGHDPEIVALWKKVLKPCGFGLAQVFRDQADMNDRIVTGSSQQGWLVVPTTQDIDGVDHFSVLGSVDGDGVLLNPTKLAEVLGKVKELLETGLPSPFFTSGTGP